MMNAGVCERTTRMSLRSRGAVLVLMIPYLFAGGGQNKGVAFAMDPPQSRLVPQQYPTIQAAVDAAEAGGVIQVTPGIYRENITITGKELILRSVDPNDPNVTARTVIEGDGTNRVVSLQNCTQRCILAGLTIRGGGTGLWCSGGQPGICACQIIENTGSGLELSGGAAPAVERSIIAANGGFGMKMPQASGRTGVGGAPVIVNCTIAQNAAGGIYGGVPVVCNSILYFNGTQPGGSQINAQRPQVTYSCVQGGFLGEGNASMDPLFARPGRWTEPNDVNHPTRTWLAGDYHLQSKAGRWDPSVAASVTDESTSLCINAASPADPVGLEPQPNGRRADMGAYGGTPQASKTLVEPGELCYELEFSTYIGGAGYDDGFFQSVDRDGFIYLTGNTASPDFPTTSGAYDRSLSPTGGAEFATDLFVIKMSLDGRSLAYSTFIGGVNYDGHDYWNVVDESGLVCLVAQTASRDYPVTPDAYDRTYNGDDVDVVVTVLDASGARLDYSTFLGGSGTDNPAGVQMDKAGDIYVYGWTDSGNFPRTPGAYDVTPDASPAAFLAKLNPAQRRLEYSTFLPGAPGMDSKVIVDEQGNAYICTSQVTAGFPTTRGVLFENYQGGPTDVYIAKLNPAGTGLVFATYLGGSSKEEVGEITLDKNGNLVIVGMTQSTDFPTTDVANEPAKAGTSYTFIAVVDPTGHRLVSSSLVQEFQGTMWDVSIDPTGKLLAVSAETDRPNMPTTAYAFDATHNADSDIYLAVYDYQTLQRRYATYIGGSAGDVPFSLDFDKAGNLCVSGNTFSTDFPLMNAWQSVYKGGYKDGIVLRLRRVLLDEDEN